MLYDTSKTAIRLLIVAVIFAVIPVLGQMTERTTGTCVSYAGTEDNYVDSDGVKYCLIDFEGSGGNYAVAVGFSDDAEDGDLRIQENITRGDKVYEVREIDPEAFALYNYSPEGTPVITSVTIPGTISDIGGLAFYGQGITELDFPEGLIRISESAFSHCKNLTTVKLPSTITLLEDYCFLSCSSLTSVTSYSPSSNSCYVGDIFGEIPQSQLTVYGYGGDLMDYAVNAGFNTVSMDEPEWLRNEYDRVIAFYTFDTGTGTVTVSPFRWTESQQPVDLSQKTLYNDTQTVKHIIIENGIGILSEGMFIEENNIESISLPATLRSVGTGNPEEGSLFQPAFARCKLSGTGFVVDPENPYLAADNGSLFNKDKTYMYTYFGRTDVKTFTVPETVKYMAFGCFYAAELDKLVLQGDGLKLQDYAIEDSIIGVIEIREGVRKLGDYSGINGFTSVTLPASLESVGDQNGIINAESLKSIRVAPGNTTFAASDGVLYRIKDSGKLSLYKYPLGKDDATFTTAPGTAEIGERAFRRVNAALDVTLSADVINISSGAFQLVNDLTLTVVNPACTFGIDAIEDGAHNVKLRGEEGSTARDFYDTYHSEDPRWSFEVTETPTVQLEKPKNLKWSGDTLSWTAVSGADSYVVDLYTKDPMGTIGKITMIPVAVSSASFTYDSLALDCYWYKTSKYWCEVRAYGAGYLPSEEVRSPERSGNYYTVKALKASIDGDELITGPYVEPYVKEHELDLHYLIDVYDDDTGIQVVSDRPFDGNWDLRALASTYSLNVSRTYRIIVTAQTSRMGFFHVPISFPKELYWYYGEKSLSDCSMPGSLPDKTYTGSPVEPVIKIFDGKTMLSDGTDYKATVSNNKNVGTATVIIIGQGSYGGVKTYTFKINPKGTGISKLIRAKKAITVKWKKQSAKMSTSVITGYQIQVATNKTFTKNKKTVTVNGYKKTSKKIGKLKKKKKYYVHVRTYKMVNGVNYYSGWSSIKTVKTK